MITDSNQPCLAKMIGRRVQEGRVEKGGRLVHLQMLLRNDSGVQRLRLEIRSSN